MNGDWSSTETPGVRRRPLFAWVILPALFFLLGVTAMGWLLTRWDAGARMLGVAPGEAPAATTAPAPATTASRPAPVRSVERPDRSQPERIVIDPEITRRVAALEQRVERVSLQSRAAIGNADRAEGLLVAFAARRALDRGVALGFLEALLRQRFGDTQPQAVGTVIAAARNPVTLQDLQEGLQEVGPELVGTPPDLGWWGAFRAELADLVVVRREGTSSTEPAARLDRATRRLEAGQVDVALAEVLRMPGRERAAIWIRQARRYVTARRALDTVETAALLEPRGVPAPGPAPVPQEPGDGPAPDVRPVG